MEDPRQETEELEEQERVARFLLSHPDFFIRRSDLLSVMNIPHLRAEGTASLIERQVKVLRDKQRVEREHLQALVETARENERLANRLHNFSLELMQVDDMDVVLDTVPPLVKELFRVDSAVIRVEHIELAGQRTEIVHPSEPRFVELRARVTHGRSVCETTLPSSIQEYVFGGDADHLSSIMLVPLGGKRPLGVMCLASTQKGRFDPEQGTFYLDRLGELTGAVLSRLVKQAS